MKPLDIPDVDPSIEAKEEKTKDEKVRAEMEYGNGLIKAIEPRESIIAKRKSESSEFREDGANLKTTMDIPGA